MLEPIKLDILVFAAHPDDAELACAGTIVSAVAQGKKVGIVDFTQGEMGTRGNPDLRMKEADAAAKIMGLSFRYNMGFSDVWFKNDQEHQTHLAKIIRLTQPEIVLANALVDRHPDHGKGGDLASDACFISGFAKLKTEFNGTEQAAWRPKRVFRYIQDRYIQPDFVVDVTDFWQLKLQAIQAYGSQFYNPDSSEPATYISRPDFYSFIEGRAREMGQKIGATFGEGFTSVNPIKVQDLSQLI